MRIPISSRRPALWRVWIGLRLASLLGLATVGVLLLCDRAGLEAEYFALGAPWEGRPFHTTVGEPALEEASQVSDSLRTKVVFSIRWRGWWKVAEGGEHRFSLDADDGGYLEIDDQLIVDSGHFGEPIASGRMTLDAGFHAVEIGLHQTYGESRLAVRWQAPGAAQAAAATLPSADLYAGRPLLLRQALRRALPTWPRPWQQLLGVSFLLAAALLVPGLARRVERPIGRLRDRLAALDGRVLRTGLLLGLFVAAFLGSLPYTGMLLGGDDTAYLNAATFNTKEWFYNRYAHVYLLKLFTTLAGGEPLVGVRVWWSFTFAATVAALALSVRSLGSGLQLRTLAVTLFVLLSQTSIFGIIGAGFSDFTAMMFITAAVAVYLSSLDGPPGRPPPGHEWHALALGALALGAFRSKEVGAIAFALPLFFLLEGGRLDLRRFLRKTAYCLAGVLAALVVLALADGWVLGHPLMMLKHDWLARSDMNFPGGVAPRKPPTSWLQTVWFPRQHDADVTLRYLWLGVCASALVAGIQRRRIEQRLLHLLPIAYLLALVALYIRMPHPFSSRMLIPILPVASLMTGLLLHYAGLDEVPWRKLFEPKLLVPTTLVTAVVVLFAIPYRIGTLEVGEWLPLDQLRRFGWGPEHFATGVLLPAAVLLLVAGVALVGHRQAARVAALLVLAVTVFGVGFELNRSSLAQHSMVQKGELLLYPWKRFRSELDAAPGPAIALSRDLQTYFHMSARTRTSIGRLALDRRDFHVSSARHVPADADLAIASRYAYQTWRQQMPTIATTATFDPDGFLVLVRPKAAVELAEQQPEMTEKHQVKSLGQRLAESRGLRDPEARRSLLRGILDRLEGPGRGRTLSLRRLQGDRLRAVFLSPDGWTDGARPAGLLVENLEATPWVQKVRLAVHAKGDEYPIRVFVDDGHEVATVIFERSSTRQIALTPVPPQSTGLFIVWTDKAWLSPKDIERALGVRVLAPTQD